MHYPMVDSGVLAPRVSRTTNDPLTSIARSCLPFFASTHIDLCLY